MSKCSNEQLKALAETVLRELKVGFAYNPLVFGKLLKAEKIEYAREGYSFLFGRLTKYFHKAHRVPYWIGLERGARDSDDKGKEVHNWRSWVVLRLAADGAAQQVYKRDEQIDSILESYKEDLDLMDDPDLYDEDICEFAQATTEQLKVSQRTHRALAKLNRRVLDKLVKIQHYEQQKKPKRRKRVAAAATA